MATSITLVAPGEVLELISDGTDYHVVSRGSGSLSGSFQTLGGGGSTAGSGSFSEVHGFNIGAGGDLILTGTMALIPTGLVYFQHSGILVNVSISARLPPTGQKLEIMILKNGIPILAAPLVVPDGLTNTKVYIDAGFITSPPNTGPQAIPIVGALAAIPASPPPSPPVTVVVDEFTIQGRYVATSGPTTNAQDVWIELCEQY
jgi:hypothetical protein